MPLIEPHKPHAWLASVILPLRCAICGMTRSARVFEDHKWQDIHVGEVPAATRADRLRAAIDANLPQFTPEDLTFLREVETMSVLDILRRLQR